MEFSIKALSPESAKTGCLVLGVYRENGGESELTAPARRADQAAKGALRAALRDLPAKAGGTLVLRSVGGLAAERVLLVSLGARKDFAEAPYRDAVRGAAAALRELGAKDAALFLVDLKAGSRPLRAIIQGSSMPRPAATVPAAKIAVATAAASRRSAKSR